MKVGFILPGDGVSGGIYVVYRHAHYLSSRGHDVSIIFSATASPKIESVRDYPLPVLLLEEAVQAETTYDAVVATWWETYYDMFRIDAKRYLYFCQSDERRFYPSSQIDEILFAERTYIDRTVGVITMARWLVEWLSREFGICAEYAPNGIDTGLFNPHVKPLVPRGEKIRVLIEGPGGVHFKRIDLAFRTAARVPGIEIWYVSGDGVVEPHWKYDRVFRKLRLDEMPPVYASCDILLKLSAVESFSYPPLEMMACGGTAVASRFTGHEEYLRDGENALLVGIDDEEGAYLALKRLVEDSALRGSLSEAGQKTAADMEWKMRAPLFEKALETLTGRMRPVSRARRNMHMLFGHLRRERNRLSVSQSQIQLTQAQLQSTQAQLQSTQTQLQSTQTLLEETQDRLRNTQETLEVLLRSETFLIGKAIVYVPRQILMLVRNFHKRMRKRGDAS